MSRCVSCSNAATVKCIKCCQGFCDNHKEVEHPFELSLVGLRFGDFDIPRDVLSLILAGGLSGPDVINTAKTFPDVASYLKDEETGPQFWTKLREYLYPNVSIDHFYKAKMFDSRWIFLIIDAVQRMSETKDSKITMTKHYVKLANEKWVPLPRPDKGSVVLEIISDIRNLSTEYTRFYLNSVDLYEIMAMKEMNPTKSGLSLEKPRTGFKEYYRYVANFTRPGYDYSKYSILPAVEYIHKFLYICFRRKMSLSLIVGTRDVTNKKGKTKVKDVYMYKDISQSV